MNNNKQKLKKKYVDLHWYSDLEEKKEILEAFNNDKFELLQITPFILNGDSQEDIYHFAELEWVEES